MYDKNAHKLNALPHYSHDCELVSMQRQTFPQLRITVDETITRSVLEIESTTDKNAHTN